MTPEMVLQVDQQLSPSITEMHASKHELKKSGASGVSDSEKASISMPVLEIQTLDIEHVPVQNDPRKWSSFHKVSFVTQVSILSTTSYLFYYPLSYIACHPGINILCSLHRWTWRQYTEP